MLRKHFNFSTAASSVKNLSASPTPLLLSSHLISASSPSSSSSTENGAKREWGSWTDESNKSSSSSGNGNAASYSSQNTQRWDEGENMSRINHYDSKAFSGAAKRSGTTIICRQKPIVRSYVQLAMEYLRPKKEVQNSYIDSQQLAKIVGYLVIPVLTIIFWKGHYEEFPDYWERQAASVQSKPLNDAEDQKKKYSYFDVIESLESRRENEMIRKGYGSQATTPAGSAALK